MSGKREQLFVYSVYAVVFVPLYFVAVTIAGIWGLGAQHLSTFAVYWMACGVLGKNLGEELLALIRQHIR